jgi:hypothetical protein
MSRTPTAPELLARIDRMGEIIAGRQRPACTREPTGGRIHQLKEEEYGPMSRAKITVQHCVANATTRQYGPHPTSDLLGVDYIIGMPADCEFPRTLARIDLFVRFVVIRHGSAKLWVQVRWLDDPQRNQPPDHGYRSDFDFRPGETYRDQVFRLANIRLGGEGRYAIHLSQRRRHRWKGHVWAALATEYFFVERTS